MARCSLCLKISHLERNVPLVPWGSKRLGSPLRPGLAGDPRDDSGSTAGIWEPCDRGTSVLTFMCAECIIPVRENFSSAELFKMHFQWALALLHSVWKHMQAGVDWQPSTYGTTKVKVETWKATALIHWELKATEPNFFSFIHKALLIAPRGKQIMRDYIELCIGEGCKYGNDGHEFSALLRKINHIHSRSSQRWWVKPFHLPKYISSRKIYKEHFPYNWMIGKI